MANISSDFDGTIRSYDGKPITKIINMLKSDIANGDNVTIVTKRPKDSVHAGLDGAGVIDFVQTNIGNVPVIFTYQQPKWKTLKKENIDVHYDDDQEDIDLINQNLPNVQTILTKEDKSDERTEALKLKDERQKENDAKIYGDKTVLVFDHGLYFHVAQKMASSFGIVYYYTPWETGFPLSNDTMVGSGFPNVIRINKFFDFIDDIDLFVFTDIYHSDLQLYLQGLGKRVWGARNGDTMEIYRWEFIQTMRNLGMPTPETELVIGLANLRERLMEVTDKFIKTDCMTRGDIETFHHVEYAMSEPILDKLAYDVGPKADTLRFIIQDPIPTSAEIGYDGFTIDGEFPDTCLFGIEVKDRGYVGEIRKYEDIPKEIHVVNDYLAPIFKKYGYRGMFSTEIRVGEDGKAYLIDPTCRFPSPPSSTMMELFDNMAEIMYEGADGKMTQVETTYSFGAEVICTSDFLLKSFVQLFYEDDDAQFIKQPNPCMINGMTYSIPQKYEDMNIVCSIVAVGDNIEQVVEDLTERCSRVKAYKLNADCSVLTEAIEELNKL